MSEDDPITGIGVVESLSNVPQGYTAISSSADGKDADIWKDGFFGRAVRRYICFTRVFPLDNGRWRNVVKDIRIVKDGAGAAPPGYVVISQTMGSAQRQPALQGIRLFIKNEPRDNCEGAFTDLLLVSKDARNEKSLTTSYIKIGELNGMFLYGKWKNLPPLPTMNGQGQPQVMPQAGSTSQNANPRPNEFTSVNKDGFEVVGRNTPQVFRPNNQWSAMTLERQKSEILTTGIDGVQFVINPKYYNNNSCNTDQFVLPTFDLMSMDEINSKYKYSLDLERSLLN